MTDWSESISRAIEYIRNRKLSLAGHELLNTNNKIIDIALKYGYDSPDSFTKAFTRFHGSTPTAVRNGAKIKEFTPLKINLILKGGNTKVYLGNFFLYREIKYNH